MPSLAALPSRIRSTTFSPNSVGQGADAEVDLLGLGQVELDAAVLRHALLGDVQLRHHLQARGDARLQLDRHLGHLLEQAVDAQAHAVFGLVGLEVDVRGAAPDRVHQHLVDELHHRGVVALGVDAGVVVQVVVAAAGLQVLQAFARRRRHRPARRRLPATGRCVRRSRSSSTRIGSTVRLVWNLISSSARVLVGSEMPTNRRLPRLNSGRTWCLRISSSLTSLIADWRRVERGRVEQRHAELGRVGRGQLRRGDQPLLRPGTAPAACFSAVVALVHRLARGGLVQRAVQHQAPGDAGDAHQIGGCYGCHPHASCLPEPDFTANSSIWTNGSASLFRTACQVAADSG